jgi:hypothetical protein
MCLLDADVGIIMNSASMVDKCKKLGLQIQDDESIPKSLDEVSHKDKLYHVSDFHAFT